VRIVLDTDVLATALLYADSDARRVLVLATYGATVHYLDVQVASDRRAMEDFVRAHPGARIGGGERVVDVNAARRSEIARRLPSGAPDDVHLIVTPKLVHGVDERIKEKVRDNPWLMRSAHVARTLRLPDAIYDSVDDAPPDPFVRRFLRRLGSISRIALVGAGPRDEQHPPVHAARSSEALLLTGTAESLQRYGRMTSAKRFAEFVDQHPWGESGFKFWEVDGRLLNRPDVWGRSAH
jgi:hypothetical protein